MCTTIPTGAKRRIRALPNQIKTTSCGLDLHKPTLSSRPTMTTTNDCNEFPPLACPTFTQVAEMRNITRKPSWWQRLKRKVAKDVYTSGLFGALCCTPNDAYADFKQCEKHERAVRLALMQSRHYGSANSAITIALDHALKEGYDMRQSVVPKVEPYEAEEEPEPETGTGTQTVGTSTASTTTGQTEGDAEERVLYARPRATPVAAPTPPPPPPPSAVRAVPAFTAAVVTSLRCKLGQRPGSTPGNKEVVEREALRLMRDYNVREIDRITHLPLIIRAYFNEDVHYRAVTHASRMSKFQKWLLGRPTPVMDDVTC